MALRTAPVLQARQTLQEWGNGLAVRLTAPIAKAACLQRGSPVAVEVVEGGVFIHAIGPPRMTLAQKLAQFDPAVHGGEAMASARVGAERF